MTISNRPSLTRSQYVVLGLITRYGPLSPYELKARVAESIGLFWPIPHAQLYRDSEQLAALGLLQETAEDTGRRRRIFDITADGRRALEQWLTDPGATATQIRDPALLKLAFADLGPDQTLAALAAQQVAIHHHRVTEYEHRAAALAADDLASPTRRHLLTVGRAIEAAYVTFWEQLATGDGTGL